eukprot:976672-Prorocentrum_minimum.AAC.1
MIDNEPYLMDGASGRVFLDMRGGEVDSMPVLAGMKTGPWTWQRDRGQWKVSTPPSPFRREPPAHPGRGPSLGRLGFAC